MRWMRYFVRRQLVLCEKGLMCCKKGKQGEPEVTHMVLIHAHIRVS
jgi:hypothetical protein